MLDLIVSALIVMALSLAIGALVTALARSRARRRGDEAALARVSMLGTPRQRRTTMWMAVALGAVGVVLAMAGATAGTAGLIGVLSLALGGQAALLEAVARMRGQGGDSGSPAER